MMNSYQEPEQVKPHVLVVDDEIELCQMVATCLKRAGFHTSSAGNAAEAYKMLEQELYDAIITDVMMPGEDGVVFLGRVHNAWPDIPVVLMTGYPQLQMAINAIKNGAFDFVHKPFDFGHMIKIVERAVSYSRLQRMEKNYRAELEDTVARRTAELKDALLELDSARSELLISATEKSDFMSTVSHEMRTPMNGVIGGLSLLEDEVTTAAGKEYLEIVCQSADRMVKLIDQLLTFGRGIGSDKRAARYDLVTLLPLLNGVIEKNRRSFSEKGISLALDVAPNVPHEIFACEEHLNRILGLLLGNALKFTDSGSVKLEVCLEDADNETAVLLFCVTDSGIGIPEDMLVRIFEPFVQGDGSFTRRHGGMGLGLAIAQQTALILNGKLRAENVPGGGSRFIFSMKVENA